MEVLYQLSYLGGSRPLQAGPTRRALSPSGLAPEPSCRAEPGIGSIGSLRLDRLELGEAPSSWLLGASRKALEANDAGEGRLQQPSWPFHSAVSPRSETVS